MEKGLRVDPPPWLETVVRLVVPPVCREHVLGDLRERLQASPSPSPFAYFSDALQTVPLVAWSQMRRGASADLLQAQGLVVYGAFLSGTIWVYGRAASEFLTTHHGAWFLALPTLVALLVITAADAYVSQRESLPIQAGVVSLGLAVAGLANMTVQYTFPGWAVPTGVLMWGLMIGFGCLPSLRYLWAAPHRPDQLATAGGGSSAGLHARAARFSRGVGRRTTAGYVIALVSALAFGRFALIATNPLQQIGAGLTVSACLYFAYQLRHARPSVWPPDAPESSWLPAYRADLVRQRDFHGGSLFWYRLVALIPGYFLFLAGMAAAHPESIRRVVMIGGAFLLFSFLAIPLNRRAAQRYQRQLDDLRG